MKYILFLLFITASFSASAQTDSSAIQLPITLKLKVKVWKQMASYISYKSPVSDTVLKCIGSGSALQSDSLSTGTVRAGRFFQFMDRWTNESAGSTYDLLNELLTSTAAQGGLMPQINAIINSGSSTAAQKQIAGWLKTQLQLLFANKTADGIDRGNAGFERLKNLVPIIID